MTIPTAVEHPQRKRTDSPSSYQADARTHPAPSDGARNIEYSEAVRTQVNFWFALVALVLLTPLILLIAAAIKLTSKGPIIYTQPRVGLDRRREVTSPNNYRRVQDLGGRPFRIYKFRTMRVDAERESGVVWASNEDERVTWLGKTLRKTRLDELPQFFNVIRGEMSIVGPRPERPAIFANLKNEIDNYEIRQRAMPGITGLAQISQAYDATIDDVRRKVQYDLEYIERQSIFEDLRIMAKTVPVVLFRRGGW